ncbi:SRPBCC family protein [Solwaraspora sp. WMMD1047]|uniref:SRPBCC family protein n=1 Tax=Solwaraspora sp. WMMD1047 TaxID=3016102 RepID=UPI002417E0C4|nr:SRPBCC family protein [Solwaraspora sp. WMMD1047]MDG4834215.1 SRPBCC family protein [Solwaraspora sp. WMMD1047]
MAYSVHVEESIDIAAPPEDVYDVIVDVARWGRFSPECTGASLPHHDGPLGVGSTFSGHNRRGAIRRWRTHCTVTAAEPGRQFSFDTAAVGLAIATWSYHLAPLDGGRGTRLTQVWHDNRGQLMKTIAVIVSGIRDRGTHNRASIQITQQRLKAHFEGQPADNHSR